MRPYELMVILDPTLDERTVAPSLETFLNVVRKDGGTGEFTSCLTRQSGRVKKGVFRMMYNLSPNATSDSSIAPILKFSRK